MKSVPFTLGNLLYQRLPFVVPTYQRAYAWEEEELGDFVQDFKTSAVARQLGTPRRHFFGGLVSVEYSASNAPGRKFEIVDGQQRLATFGILFSRLVQAHRKLAFEAQSDGDTETSALATDRADRIRDQLLEYKDEIDGKPATLNRIVLSKADRSFYEALLKGSSIEPKRASHMLLLDAKNRIEKFIETELASFTDGKSRLAHLDVLAKTSQEDCYVIHLVSEDKQEAYRLFEVLNDRGRSLSEGDLLRSTTLERLEGAPSAQSQAEEAWDEVLAAKANVVEGLLRSYYASRRGTRAGHRSLFDDFLTAFITPAGTDAKAIVDVVKDIQATFRIYTKLQDAVPEWPYDPASTNLWQRNRLALLLQVLKSELSIPLLLAATKLPEDQFAEIVQILEVVVFRYVIASRQHPGKLDKVLLKHAIEIRQDPSKYKTSALRFDLKNEFEQKLATDSVFGPGMRAELMYKERSGNTITKYFLTTLEHFHSWYAKGATGRPKCLDQSYVFDLGQIEIEHVYPRKASTQNKALEPLKHNLGNLSFWAPTDNTKAGNDDFASKKKLYKESKVGLNQELATLAQFEPKELNDRESELVKRALAIFRL